MRWMFAAVVLSLASHCVGETITVATYNIEHFHDNFEGHRMKQRAATELVADQEARRERDEFIRSITREDDEDNWELAETILDPELRPDILFIQESAGHKDLEFFNKRWLNNFYSTVIQFQNNTGRDQHLAVMLKQGFEILERRDNYYQEMGPDNRPLFARGPAFIKVRTPLGYVFWAGTTHQKSKGVSLSPEAEAIAATQPAMRDHLYNQERESAARWRAREAKRTHEILREIEAAGPSDVILAGDMNDDPGFDEAEKAAGEDAITLLVGPAEHGLLLATRPLIEAGEISFGGYFNTRHRSFIDQVIVTRSMTDQIQHVKVMRGGLARVASDHYPVIITLRSDVAETGAAGLRDATP